MARKFAGSGALAGAAVLALATLGCGSSDDDPPCSPPAIDGVPFTAMGSATLTGKGTLPARVPDGVDLQLMVDAGGFSMGVLRQNLLEPDLTCGRSFTYTVRQLEAGTYTLEFDARVPNSESQEAEYEGRATQSFTIADGQTLSFDSTFE
jgi:hypothetical protein